MIFDVHCHPQFPEYDGDRDQVIRRAQEAGVKMICVGTNIASSEEAILVAEKYPKDVWATVGLHPTEFTSSPKFTSYEDVNLGELKRMAGNPKVVALGECGLDYYRSSERKDEQKRLFLEQIKIAEELKKPLMIHCRPSRGSNDAYEDLLREFSIFNFQFSKIVHFFVGSLDVAKKFLDLGCHFTFGGVITFARDYDEVIKFLPLERILLETDAPYVTPQPYRGQRNEPAYVVEVAKKIAELKDLSLEAVTNQTTENTRQVFNILVASH